MKGEENLGMAMTFTLVSHLREQLATLVHTRAEKRRHEEMEKERLALEVRSRTVFRPSILTLSRRKKLRREALQSRWNRS